jgi:hypothetical protein
VPTEGKVLCGRRMRYSLWVAFGWQRQAPCAEVAQLVEHATENRGVAGSSPALGTIILEWPSGKAADSESEDRRFESFLQSHNEVKSSH